MKYRLRTTGRFKKELRKIIKQGHDTKLMDEVVSMLAEGKPLPAKYKDHALGGGWYGSRECHILPDWLLIYQIEDDVLVLVLSRTGSHSDLFG